MLDGLVNYTLPIKKVPSNRPLIPYWSPLIPHFVLMNSHSFPCFFPCFLMFSSSTARQVTKNWPALLELVQAPEVSASRDVANHSWP